ncbi:MAG: polymer-forming cytoskeletal protein [Syntrophorhabdales bacterium]|jgi:cytoskeletal protein CcmA (bactofilin family)
MRDVQAKALNIDETNVTTTLAEDLHITGTMKFKSSLMIEGTFDGEIISEGLLIVGPTAKVTAKVTTKKLVSHGEVTGDVTASEQVVLKETATQSGNITTPYLIVESGSIFNGSCVMEREAVPESSLHETGSGDSGSGTEGQGPRDSEYQQQEREAAIVKEEMPVQEAPVSVALSGPPEEQATTTTEDLISTRDELEKKGEETDEGGWWQGAQRTHAEQTPRSPKGSKTLLF